MSTSPWERFDTLSYGESSPNLWVEVAVDAAGVVRSADFGGSSYESEPATYRTYATEMLGRSLRDAAEHSALVAYRQLVTSGLLQLPSQIGLPHLKTFAPELAAAEVLVRKAYARSDFYVVSTPLDPETWNFEDIGISSQWTILAVTDKINRITRVLGECLLARGVAHDQARVVSIDQYERIEMEFESDCKITGTDQPRFVFEFEQTLRSRTGERLEVFVTERRDGNRVRFKKRALD